MKPNKNMQPKIILKCSIHTEKKTTSPLKTQKKGFIKYFVKQLNNRVQFLSTFIKFFDRVLKSDDYFSASDCD